MCCSALILRQLYFELNIFLQYQVDNFVYEGGDKLEKEEMNLYQKLASIRKKVEVIQKDKAGYGYNYVSEEEILAKLKIWLDKMGLLLIPEIIPDSTHVKLWDMEQTKKTKDGPIAEKKCEVVVSGEMAFTWIDIANPEEKLIVPWAFYGQQADASQAFGSGLTYCTRYFLLKFFNIATTDDDPDNWRTKQKMAEKEEDHVLVKGIIEEIDKVAKEYVANSEDPETARTELTKEIKKYVKSGNYNKITEPALAKKLLDELTKMNTKGEK